MPAAEDHAGIRFPPPLAYLGTLLLGLAVGSLLGRPGLGLDPTWLYVVGGILVLAGLALILSAAGLFRKMGTELKPWLPSTKLVESGAFRFTRNPMYLGMTLIYAGLAIGLDSVVALVLLVPLLAIIQTQVIANEERYLERRFGAPYLDYRTRVRRWF